MPDSKRFSSPLTARSLVSRGLVALVSGAILFTAAPGYAQKKNAPVYREDIGDLKYTGPGWVRGEVVRLSATPDGILVAFKNNAMPANCNNTGAYWVLIPERNSTMTHLFISAWEKGQRQFRISTDRYVGPAPANPYADRGSNYCTATRIDVAYVN